MLPHKLPIIAFKAAFRKLSLPVNSILLPNGFLHILLQIKQIDRIITLAEIGEHIFPQLGFFFIINAAKSQ